MYNMDMDTKGFTVDDRCTVHPDWGSGACKGKRVRICKFQRNDRQCFAIVSWGVGKQARALEDEYGTLFNVDELKKVK